MLEQRTVKKGKEERTETRVLGLIVLRGIDVLYVSVEQPPAQTQAQQKAKGPGTAQPFTRPSQSAAASAGLMGAVPGGAYR
ncbi:hypothetical protein KIPB_011935 [Kipferlia bialata]|uniref:LSM domain-containing protein n=1 Tax=Kipferlia bialata TaxID=797122 RepID=A0A9K3D5Z4_9EUKA|nr:hypothetical protein KIPB_011935 [Kipferlia bialata]|eukprot:g11935.t1